MIAATRAVGHGGDFVTDSEIFVFARILEFVNM
jgi:hypothetical protein